MGTRFRKKRFPRQNIRSAGTAWMKKEQAQVSWIVGLFLALFLAVFLMAIMQVERFHTVSLYTEDALAASNLASALIDLEEYGVSHRILIVQPTEAYGRYQWALKENLNLNGEWLGSEESVISGPVTVENYTVYNVEGDKVRGYRFGAGGESAWEENLGVAKAPNGIGIENTSVYSEISFEVMVVPGIGVRVRKGNLVDVVASRGND